MEIVIVPLTNASEHRRSSEKDQPVTSKTAAFLTATVLLADPEHGEVGADQERTSLPTLERRRRARNCRHGAGPLGGVTANPCRTGSVKAARGLFHSRGRTGRSHRHHEAAQRNPRRSTACRKVGKRSVITAQDLESWAAALPDIRDVAPDKAAAALQGFRKSALTET